MGAPSNRHVGERTASRRAQSVSASQPAVSPVLLSVTLALPVRRTTPTTRIVKRSGGQLVPLPGRCRVEKRTHDDRADGAAGLVDAACLTPAERAVLFGVPAIDETTQLWDVMVATTGLAASEF